MSTFRNVITQSFRLSLLLLIFSSLTCGWQQLFPSGFNQSIDPTTNQSTNRSLIARMGHTTIALNDSMLITFGGRAAIWGSINDSVTFSGSDCSYFGGCNEGANAGVCILSITHPLNQSINQSINGTNTTSSNSSISQYVCDCNAGYEGANCDMTYVITWLSDVLLYDIDSNAYLTLTSDLNTVASPVPWPSARYQHSAVLLNHSMVIYGGFSQLCGDYCSDVWAFSLDRLDALGRGRWRQLNTSLSSSTPGIRWQHSAVAYNDSMYVFGGHRHGGVRNDLWRLDHLTGRYWVWTELQPSMDPAFKWPLARFGHACAVDVVDGLMYLYGGLDPSARSNDEEYFLNDFWTYSFTSNNWSTIQSLGDAIDAPSYLSGARSAMSDYMFFLFGGYYDNSYDSRIWRYNSSSGYWTQHQIPVTVRSLPAERNFHELVFISERHSFFLFGGWGSESSGGNTIDETYYNDLWQLDLNVCPDDCNGRGSCSYGYCFCDANYWGVDCQNQRCESSRCTYSGITLLQVCTHCGGHGECRQGACLCSDGFITRNETNACTLPFCPRDCSGNGQCVAALDGYQCKCNDGFYGRDCSLGYCTTNCNSPYGACNTTTATCQCAVAPMGRYAGESCTRFLTNA